MVVGRSCSKFLYDENVARYLAGKTSRSILDQTVKKKRYIILVLNGYRYKNSVLWIIESCAKPADKKVLF